MQYFPRRLRKTLDTKELNGKYRKMMKTGEKMKILITGAASGIGLAAANCFKNKGHSVYAVDIRKAQSAEVSFEADIRDEGALNAIKEQLVAEGVEFDAIITVAGVHTMAALAESDFCDMKRLIDINLLGTMLTVRVFHELLSKSGRVVIVTSEVATYTPMPFNGLYNVSKTALDCYADALRQELNLLGQKVIAVRPGAVQTPLASSSADSTDKLAESTVLYSAESKHFASLVKKFTGTPMPPEKFAKTLYRATTAKHPRLAYSKHRNIGLVFLNILPKRLQCAIIKMLLKR